MIEEANNRVIIAVLKRGRFEEDSIEELVALAEAAELEVEAVCVQALDKPIAATYIGSGKVIELAEMGRNMDVGAFVFNNELSGVQIRNLEEAMGIKVIDRTILILDIFAKRAATKLGKLQVELAQLRYRKARLIGFGNSLSRQGGGIGARGPGEKKLETDKRHIEETILDIKAEIKQSETVRATQRKHREKNAVPIVALVGYTNAGKSALMNRLLGEADRVEKSVFEKDMLFATLDTSSRLITLDNKRQFILIDTVGFVSNLPHTLVDAFKGTLEEASYADLLLNVIDASKENQEFVKNTTMQVLKEIGAGGKDMISVYNKIDLVQMEGFVSDDDKVYISAKKGTNTDKLLDAVQKKIFADTYCVNLLLPYDKGSIYSYLKENYPVESTEYLENGIAICVSVDEADYKRLNKYELV